MSTNAMDKENVCNNLWSMAWILIGTFAFLSTGCLLTSLFDCEWYVDVIRCSAHVSACSSFGTKFTN